jgi:uncharacterized membrane protein
MGKPRDLLGLALTTGFVLLLYWQAVSGRGFFFDRDVWLYWMPHIEWAARSLAAGQLPQWNPFSAFGRPFLADPNFQFFYPPSIPNWILPAAPAFTVLVVGHAILGATGAFRLLRPRLRSAPSALVGAAIFAAAGPVASSTNLWHHFASLMYLPWIVDAFLRLRAGRGSVRRLGLLTGLQALAGSADVCVMTGLTLLALLPQKPGRLLRLVPRLAAAVVLCLALAAVQWLPTARLAAQSARSSLGPEVRLHWSVSPQTLIDLVLPLSGAAHAAPGDPNFREERLRLIPWMYLGASTLPLLILGVRRAPRGGLFLLFVLALALGRHTPLGDVVGYLPVVSSFRFPAKLLWLATACWAALAAIGVKELGRQTPRIRGGLAMAGALMMVGAAGLAAFGPASALDHGDWQSLWRLTPLAPLTLGAMLLAISRGPRALKAVVLIVAVDLLIPGVGYNDYSSGAMFHIRPSLVDELRRQQANRIYVFEKSRLDSLRWKSPREWSDAEAYYFGQGQFLSPPQSLRWSIKGSFDGEFSGLGRLEYSILTGIAGSGQIVNEHLLRLTGVTHAVRFQGPQPAELQVVASVPTFHDRPVLVLRVPDPLPPAYVVHRIRKEPSSLEAIRAVSDPSFDGARAIVRVGEVARQDAALAVDPRVSSARIELEESGRVVIRAELSDPGTLVILNGYSEGWSARVDGRPQEVLPANLLFQSVDLGAGAHLVELEYQTPGLWPGFVLSALGWAFLVFASSREGRRIIRA